MAASERGRIRIRGYEDDLRAGARSERPRRGDTVSRTEGDVHQDNVCLKPDGGFDGLSLAVHDADDHKSGPAQSIFNIHRDQSFVLHDEHARRGIRAPASSPGSIDRIRGIGR